MPDDRRWGEDATTAGQRDGPARLDSAGSNLERKYWVSLALYAVLAVLVWLTMDAGRIVIWGKPVELRLVPLVVIGGCALRTVLGMQAEKIRRAGEKGSQ